MLLIVFTAPLVACTEEMASDERAPSVHVPALDLAARPVPQEQQYDPLFNQVSLHDRTYTLPCPLREFLDGGWVLGKKQTTAGADYDGDTLDGYASATATLDDNDGNWMIVEVQNSSPAPVVFEDADVVRMTIFADTVEPYPGIRRGVSGEDVKGILGEPDDIVDGSLVYYRNPLTADQLQDLSGDYLDHEYHGSPSEPMSSASVRLSLADGKLYGTYEISVPSLRPPGPDKVDLTVPDARHCLTADGRAQPDPHQSFDYSYSVPIELRGASASIPWQVWYVGEYKIDGQRFAVAAAEDPACDVMSYERVSEQSAYLLYPNKGSDDGWGHRLLWNDKDSSAAVTTFDGPGDLTGDGVLRVTLNYCDWDQRQRVSMSFAIIGLDPGTTISEQARDYLLGMVSDVAGSIERT